LVEGLLVLEELRLGLEEVLKVLEEQHQFLDLFLVHQGQEQEQMKQEQEQELLLLVQEVKVSLLVLVV
jgi:hypothetical protein